MKRGELSMEVIIIAAIALLVLVILTVLLLRSGTGVNEGTSCTSPSINGQCTDRDSNCGDILEGSIPSSNSCPGDQKCCVPLIKSS